MQVTRHRLCCLPPGRAHLPIKEACNLSALPAPATSKVIKTRYHIYGILKTTPVSPFSAAPFPLSPPSWRTRRLSPSRSLVLNRLRPARGGGRFQLGSPRWRDRGDRCIGGVLYRVTANKLAKTPGRPSTERGMQAPPAYRPAGPSWQLQPLPGQPGRAAQPGRRAAGPAEAAPGEQEYRMYYNPEKVAVCTRFLRGTCKKTDGTCPFSHQVSKEKMPVCSYFLKGICSNSDCPYSHVYVSRKAEVCTDFLKGYCPLGAKCKKHTLLCPDFSRRGSCPRGAQCQLLHRNQKRPGRQAAAPPALVSSNVPPRSRASTGHGPRKPSASQRPVRQTPSSPASEAAGLASPLSSARGSAAASACPLPSKAPSSPSSSSFSPSLDREEPALQEEAASAEKGSGGLSKLSSFIYLPAVLAQPRQPAQGPDHQNPPTKDSEKPLHIKPRL